MRLAILLFCSLVVFGQSASAPFSGSETGTVDVLSDTEGVDFGPYLQRILQDVRENWYRLIPQSAEMKKGKLAIEFAITKDGKVADMRLRASSGDACLDRPAWGSITASDPFPPLPSEFTRPYLALRVRFYYNPEKSDLAWKPSPGDQQAAVGESKACPLEKSFIPVEASAGLSKSGIKVTISPLGDPQVPVGGSKVITAMVTGTGAKENTVEWNVTGLGCSDSACGDGERFVPRPECPA